MTIDWTKIKAESPKAWFKYDQQLTPSAKNRDQYFDDITDFFDDLGIIIELQYMAKIYLKWTGRIIDMSKIDNEDGNYDTGIDCYVTRVEAINEAVLIAFAMLEKQLLKELNIKD